VNYTGYSAWIPNAEHYTRLTGRIIPIVDFNGDGNIDTDDLLIMIDNWSTSESLCDIGPTPFGDGIVDIED